MLPDSRFGWDNRHGIQHRRTQPIEPDEEQSVRHRQLRPRGYALTQPRLRLEWRDQDVDEQDQERDHYAISLADLAARASPDEVLDMDNQQRGRRKNNRT